MNALEIAAEVLAIINKVITAGPSLVNDAKATVAIFQKLKAVLASEPTKDDFDSIHAYIDEKTADILQPLPDEDAE